jgi:hypothetical protein
VLRGKDAKKIVAAASDELVKYIRKFIGRRKPFYG